MRFKSEKGITGIDLVVAITIILIAIGTITTVYVNINKAYRSTNRNSVAGKIATDIMTAIDVSYFFEIETTIDAMGNDNPVVVDGGKDISDLIRLLGSGANNLKIPNGYRVEVSVVEAEEPSIAVKELLKKIDIEISYLVSGEKEFVEFTKYKGRYGIPVPERPTQNFDDTDTYDYTPIKYNRLSEMWETTFFADTTWYEYTDGYWPMMIKTSKGVPALIDGKVNTAVNPQLYIWIPQISQITSEYCFTTIVEELDAGGVTRQNYYTYIQHEEDTTDDLSIPEDQRVHFVYDELAYITPPRVIFEKGWYELRKGEMINDKVIYAYSIDSAQFKVLGKFMTEDIVNRIMIENPVKIYSNQDIKLENIVNIPNMY